MNIEAIANAVMYEGYALYPYRASSVKNQQRFNFGVLYPRRYCEGSDAWSMQTECLLQGEANLNVRLRFLQLMPGAWQQGIEREVSLEASCRFSFDAIEAEVELETESLGNSLRKVRVRVTNVTDLQPRDRDEALLHSLVSAHTILTTDSGNFPSLLDPPEELRQLAAECRNIGTWPVLVGEAGSHDAMLSSPIILYDYPQIAAESPGSLFDGTEIDEILTLRIMTLTDEEKREMGNLDERTREILKRTESMPPEQFMKLHGVLRNLP